MPTKQRPGFFASLLRTQSGDKTWKGASLKGQEKVLRQDLGLPSLPNVDSGHDSSEHNELSIGGMNSCPSSLTRAKSRGSLSSEKSPRLPRQQQHQNQHQEQQQEQQQQQKQQQQQQQQQHQQQQRYVPGRIYPLIPGRLSFTAHQNDEHTMKEIQAHPSLFFFSTDLQERYLPFCSDFGPVNLGTLVQFCDHLHDNEADPRLQRRHLVYYCTNDVESLSNMAFLLSAYLVLEHGMTPEKAAEQFSTVSGIPIVPFRDPTFVQSTFPLTVLDCLRGLKKAVDCKWFDINEFDLEQYDELDHPDKGDMHQICPKFVAFRGPEQRSPHSEDSGAPTPELVIEMFKQLEVKKVIRLNDANAYNRKVFLKAGLQHVDLHFEDCTTPPDELVTRFLEECEEPGVVAVHCLAGLGRTGTMIGVWLMKEYGFTAREAIAWMRIVRPGCVIGPQQHYLEWMEGRLCDGSFPLPLTVSSSGVEVEAPQQFDAPSSASAKQLADQVRRAISHRR